MDTPAGSPGKPRPKVERRPALPPAETVYNRIRKRFHLVFFLVFVALPFSNMMRFDLPKQRFYFAGFELWIGDQVGRPSGEGIRPHGRTAGQTAT